MQMNYFIKLCLVPLLIVTIVLSKTISICSDANYWYPFSYVNDSGKAEGLHVDMLVHILDEMGYDYTIKPLPWKRCLYVAKHGECDAVLSASFKTERAAYLQYPDSVSYEKAKQYLTKVEYVVISHVESSYKFLGDVKTLPLPVRSVLGYSIIDDLSAQGVTVYSGINVLKNIEALMRSKRGVVITTPNTAKALLKRDDYGDSLQIHEVLLTSKAYYLPFSQLKTDISQEERKKIWQRCAELRKDTLFMDSLYLKYEEKAGKK